MHDAGCMSLRGDLHYTRRCFDGAPLPTETRMSAYANTNANRHRVHAAWSLFEAQLVREALYSEGIEATLKNDQLVGSIGLLPVGEVMVEVWVDKADAEKAEAVVNAVLYSKGDTPVVGHRPQDLEYSSSTKATPEHCPNCGAPWEQGFDKCWKCCATLAER